jgi:hypothetical protein
MNQMPGGITELLCSWEKKIQEHDTPGWRSLKNRINEICSAQNYRSDFSPEKAPHILKSVTV